MLHHSWAACRHGHAGDHCQSTGTGPAQKQPIKALNVMSAGFGNPRSLMTAWQLGALSICSWEWLLTVQDCSNPFRSACLLLSTSVALHAYASP